MYFFRIRLLPCSELEPLLAGGGSSAEMPQISRLAQRTGQDAKI